MAGRRLSPDEAALWRRVAGSVRAIRPALISKDAKGPPSLANSGSARGAKPLPNSPPARAGGEQQCTGKAPPRLRGGVGGGPSLAAQNTLDGTWDKTIATGRVTPDRTIDLHGYNLAAAHHRLDRGLDDAIRDGARVILLITGKAPRSGISRLDSPLRGIIRESVGDWLAASRHQPAIAAIRNAHPRHGGAGALYIVLRQKRG
jgi:DNA-nicking Smr family endonuclease